MKNRALLILVVTACLFVCASAGAQTAPCKTKDQFGNCTDEPLERVAVKTPAATELLSEPVGAEVREDGAPLGITPLTLPQKALKQGDRELAPGDHQLTFHLQDHEVYSAKVTVKKGSMLRAPAARLVPHPRVSVEPANNAAKDALFSVDGTPRGTLPIRDFPLTPGQHTLKVVKDNYEPWILTADFPSGSAPRTEPAALKPAQGKLTIKTALVGLPVFLDPDPDGGFSGADLGITPLDAVDVAAGTHVLVFRPEGAAEVTKLVVVPASGAITVPFFAPYTVASDHLDDFETIHLEKAKKACEIGIGGACRVAAHRLLHHEKNPDAEEARRVYEKGCKASDEQSCFALGYLEKKANVDSVLAASYLKKACNSRARVEDACWMRYDHELLLDPTLDPGPLESYRDDAPEPRGDGKGRLGYGPLVGAGLYDRPTFYVEMGGGGALLGLDWARFSIGFALRARIIEQLEETRRVASWKAQVGPGLDFGVVFRPLRNDSLTVSLLLRMTAYFLNQASLAPALLVGHAFADKHQLELGVILDTVPIHTHRVEAFGGVREVEDLVFRPIAVLRYSFLRDP